MFTNRRLAKRSIIGTKISALWQDGRYYPGSIQNYTAEESMVFGPSYAIQFDDGHRKEVRANEIIGPGFQTLSSVKLKNGQKLYLTLNGREVPGIVIDHDREHDVVIINVKLSNGGESEIERKTDELRLIESRKSARLVDQDTDYSKLADLALNTNENKRSRTVSHVIDVPSKFRHRGPNIEGEDQNNSQTDDDVEMDENIAAMVLTSLSCSPVSPHFHGSLTEKCHLLSSSANSSGFHSEPRSDPSPPLSSHLSESCPTTTGMFFGPLGKDEGINADDDMENSPEPKRKRSLGMTRTMFQCTWKGCGKVHNTESAIEKHVRTNHLGGKDSDSDMSDHEEEFYYTEIEVNVDNVTKTFSDMFTSSPPDHNYMDPVQYITDHDYQRKVDIPETKPETIDMKEHSYSHMYASSVPSGGVFPHQELTAPISMPQMKRSLSWQNSAVNLSPVSSAVSSPIRMTKLSPQDRLQQHQAQSPKSHMFGQSPKSAALHKKPRSEVRKCRKVYGMENREMWCTQCKWKKACSRFTD
ncbi:zinc finger protein 704-like isoform X1 [Mytilus galloprovincialis]|uniref:zinc finger protein 704-like isoform X1 n=1 Tax=Mytilus galloprovincialis TaxID=29158 RepID=UPI003F7B927A